MLKRFVSVCSMSSSGGTAVLHMWKMKGQRTLMKPIQILIKIHSGPTIRGIFHFLTPYQAALYALL